jgi:heat shock protein HtpX
MSFATVRNLRLPALTPHATANLAQAVVLLAAFALLFVAATWPLIGAWSLLVAAAAVAGMVALALRLPPQTVMRLYGARPQVSTTIQQVALLADNLARRAALPRPPRLYVVPSTMLSAFSAGTPERSAIAVTEGLLRRLTMREIAGVFAREIAHIAQGDLTVLAIADIVSRAAQLMYYAGLALAALNLYHLVTGDELVSWWSVALLVLAPALLNLLQFSLSRSRELEADRAGALLTGDPMGLASAISRLEASTGTLAEDIVPPVPARRVPQPSMLRCPPPLEGRIARLHALEVPPMPPLDIAEGPRISLVGVGPIEMRPRYRWPGVWF